MKQNYLFKRHGDEDMLIEKTDLEVGPKEVGEKHVIALEPINFDEDYIVWAVRDNVIIFCVGVFKTKEEATAEMLKVRKDIIEFENVSEHYKYADDFTDSYVELETSGVSLLMGINGG